MSTRRLVTLLLAAAALLALPAAASAGAFKAVAGNPADRMLQVPMDPYRYDDAKHCRKHPQPGTLALESWLGRNARGVFWGIMRCEKLGPGNYSLHADGRALDWHLSVHNAADRREAKRLIALMLAPDRAGNQFALARRMGVQEIIWDCHAWWGTPALVKYSVCYDSKGRRKKVDDTSAHRDHIHFGLSRAGAARRTSFWRSR